MKSRNISEEAHQGLRIIQHSAAVSGKWPSFGEVLPEFDRHGIRHPEKCLRELKGNFLQFEDPLALSRLLQMRAQGWDLANPHSTLIHDGFVTAVRQCVERVRRKKLTAPGSAGELIVPARDLWEPDASRELLSIGLLLEVHGFGTLTWDRLDAKSPFKIELDPLVVRQYASVGWFADFVNLAEEGSPPLQAIA